MKKLLPLIAGLGLGFLALASTCGGAAWLFLRNAALDRARAVTGVSWPSGSHVVSIDEHSSINSDHTEVLVELDAAAVPGFLAAHPQLVVGGCRGVTAPCAEGNTPGSVMLDWRVEFDPATRRLRERVDGFW
ncbi:MAG: hypothetical protein ACOZQL_27820 [Myxococcota bacterium]